MSSDAPSIGDTLSQSAQSIGHAATHANDIDFFTGGFGSDQSVLNQTLPSNWILGSHGLLGQNGQSAWQQVTSPQKADIHAPGAPPTLQQANITSLNGELQQEQNMRSTWGVLTGGEDLLETPTTNSQRLTGS